MGRLVINWILTRGTSLSVVLVAAGLHCNSRPKIAARARSNTAIRGPAPADNGTVNGYLSRSIGASNLGSGSRSGTTTCTGLPDSAGADLSPSRTRVGVTPKIGRAHV